jgi:long-subunit acyl-CoA synthetase (AMP-forming)
MNDFKTAHQALADWAAREPGREFLVQPVDGALTSISFREALHQARCMATALQGLGLSRGDRVAILAKNSAEWVLADLAIAMAGLVSVPIYPTANVDTVSYILEHSEAKAVFVGKLDNPDALGSAIPDSIVTIAFPYPTVQCRYDWNDLVAGAEPVSTPQQPSPKDVMTILYTSGSTGRPKGVVISYGAYHYGCNAAWATFGTRQDARVLSYLPLAHVTERTVVVGPSIYAGARIYFVESLQTFQHDLAAARPTLFASVPRLWVKFQSGIHAKIAPGKLRRLLAIPLVGQIVARKIRTGMGLESCELFGSGTAPISLHTLNWYRKLGINISEGWGMTETGGLSCTNVPFHANRLGTIGVPLDGTELKISDEGELLIRGPGLFTEYFKQPELTAESFAEDGFFRTGDKAEWDDRCQGYRITGRVKDIFKSAKGKYVAPVPIESHLSANSLVEQVCVIGSGLPAPVALVVLSETAGQLPDETVEESLESTRLEANRQLESHERLSGMLVVNDEWTTENGILTPTLKVRRERIEDRYLSVVDREFDEPVAWERDL